MNEQKILSAIIQDRGAYDSIKEFYESDDFTDLGDLVYKEVAKYYSKDSDAVYADKDSLLHRLGRAYPKHKDKFEKFINNVTDVSVANILTDYRDMKRDSYAELAGSLLIAGQHAKANELLARYSKLDTEGLVSHAEGTKVYQDADVGDFSESLEQYNRIQIAPTVLNEHLGGGLTAGCHVLVYAPPECGKTAVGINLAYSVAVQGRTCMYIGNEETDEMYMTRLLCRFTRWNEAKVLAHKDEAMALARERGWANLIFVPMSPGSVPQVQSVILEYMPEVVVIDQLSNLTLSNGSKEPEKTQLLEKLAYTMRMFYKRHKIAGISMSQADEKAIGKLHLTIKDVFYSNIAVQGQADVMIGLGMNDDYQRQGRRMMCLTKNKLGGEHVNIPVLLYNKISMLKGIG